MVAAVMPCVWDGFSTQVVFRPTSRSRPARSPPHRQPGSIPYRQGMTVLDAVLAAGGLTEFAAPDRSALYRKVGDGSRSYAVRLDRILDHGDLSTNFKVAPGDVITVPERVL